MAKSKQIKICPNCGSTNLNFNVDFIFEDGASLKECAICGKYAISLPRIHKSNVEKFKNDEIYRKAIKAKVKAKDEPYNKILKRTNIKFLGFFCIIIGMILFFILYKEPSADLFRLLVGLIISFLPIIMGIILLIKSYKK